MFNQELRSRVAELEAKIRDVEKTNPLLSHSGHLAVAREWLVELDALKAQLRSLESESEA